MLCGEEPFLSPVSYASSLEYTALTHVGKPAEGLQAEPTRLAPFLPTPRTTTNENPEEDPGEPQINIERFRDPVLDVFAAESVNQTKHNVVHHGINVVFLAAVRRTPRRQFGAVIFTYDRRGQYLFGQRFLVSIFRVGKTSMAPTNHPLCSVSQTKVWTANVSDYSSLCPQDKLLRWLRSFACFPTTHHRLDHFNVVLT